MELNGKNRLRGVTIPSSLKVLYVDGKGLSIIANKRFRRSEKIGYLEGELVNAADATAEAVQITDDQFIDTNHLVAEDFINHSCAPNARLDIVNRWFIAIKDISVDEEISYNYLTTEWDMAKWGSDFECACGSDNCLGHIKGFKYLPLAEKIRLAPLLSPFISRKLRYEISSKEESMLLPNKIIPSFSRQILRYAPGTNFNLKKER